MMTSEDIAAPAVEPTRSRLDLPGVLPLLIVAATWEFLLVRVVGVAAATVRDASLRPVVETLATFGSFVESFALLLSLALLGSTVIALVREPAFGPIPHRITLTGFAFTVVVVGALGAVMTVGPDVALLAHAGAVLFSMLVVLGLSWQPVSRRLLAGVGLFLLPTLLRFYASCAISIPMLRTGTSFPLDAYRAAELGAVLAALASPFLVTGVSFRSLIRRPPVVAVALATLPAMALAMALATHPEQVRDICLSSLGFELFLPVPVAIYPPALFCFIFSVALLVLPSPGSPRPHAEQRVGYALALLFVAGLDNLSGTVLALEENVGHVPELVIFYLEGPWDHLDARSQAMVGPPLRDLYQLVLLALGYAVLARGAFGQSRSARPSIPNGEDGAP
jgi:hypothetical protein